MGTRSRGYSGANTIHSDVSAKLPPNQMREIREAFQVLDRDNDGLVNKDDVADVLMNIGKGALFFFPLCEHKNKKYLERVSGLY